MGQRIIHFLNAENARNRTGAGNAMRAARFAGLVKMLGKTRAAGSAGLAGSV